VVLYAFIIDMWLKEAMDSFVLPFLPKARAQIRNVRRWQPLDFQPLVLYHKSQNLMPHCHAFIAQETWPLTSAK
jgi:hypothetical protein